MKRHCVYIYRDLNGEALYVGKTSQRESRDCGHRSSSYWYGEVSTVEYIECESEGESLVKEAITISELLPKHNKCIPSVSNLERKIWKMTHIEKAGKLEPVATTEDEKYYDIESFILFNFGSVYNASRRTFNHSNQINRWIKKGALISDKGEIFIKTKGEIKL